jgi:hypothetical protein
VKNIPPFFFSSFDNDFVSFFDNSENAAGAVAVAAVAAECVIWCIIIIQIRSV